MSAHTPGPWYADDKNAVYASDNRHLASVWRRPVSNNTQTGESWLDMRTRTANLRQVAQEEEIANARLIAAAPELLAELISAVQELEWVYGTDSESIMRYRAAVAKATGAA